MSISKVDSKKRIVLPTGNPGDVFDIQQQGDGRFLLVRLEKPATPPRMSPETCLEGLNTLPFNRTMPWEELRQLTRES